MRAVVQRVLEASVAVDGRKVSEVGPGLLVLLGVGKGDEAVPLLTERAPAERATENLEERRRQRLSGRST